MPSPKLMKRTPTMQRSAMTERDQEMQNPKQEEPRAGGLDVTCIPSCSGGGARNLAKKKSIIFHQPCDFPKNNSRGSHFPLRLKHHHHFGWLKKVGRYNKIIWLHIKCPSTKTSPKNPKAWKTAVGRCCSFPST